MQKCRPGCRTSLWEGENPQLRDEDNAGFSVQLSCPLIVAKCKHWEAKNKINIALIFF